MNQTSADPRDLFFGAHPETLSEGLQMTDETELEVLNKSQKERSATVPYQPTVTPMDLLQQAVASGADLERMEKLMDMQERWEANEARKAFVSAMSAFSTKAPTIDKTRDGHNIKYAGLAETLDQIKPLLADNGLSHSWKTETADATISVTCCVTHVAGHQECTSMSAAADTSGSKNAIQAVGSTITYLQRYTLFAILGLASKEQDDDGGLTSGNISEEQKAALIELMKETDTEASRFLKFLKVKSLDELPIAKYGAAEQALRARRQPKAEKEANA